MPRRARLDAPVTLHHVIVRGIERRTIVDDVANRKRYTDPHKAKETLQIRTAAGRAWQ